MNNSKQERRQALIFHIAVTSIVLALVIVLAIIGTESYIRWTLNKDFMVLGGFELEALTISAFALILGMVYLYRPHIESDQITQTTQDSSARS